MCCLRLREHFLPCEGCTAANWMVDDGQRVSDDGSVFFDARCMVPRCLIFCDRRCAFLKRKNATKMAMLPELSKLRVAPLAGEKVWPILQTENVFILPGVPEFFQSKMAVIADHFLDSRPMVRNFCSFLSERNSEYPR